MIVFNFRFVHPDDYGPYEEFSVPTPARLLRGASLDVKLIMDCADIYNAPQDKQLHIRIDAKNFPGKADEIFVQTYHFLNDYPDAQAVLFKKFGADVEIFLKVMEHHGVVKGLSLPLIRRASGLEIKKQQRELTSRPTRESGITAQPLAQQAASADVVRFDLRRPHNKIRRLAEPHQDNPQFN